MQAPSKAIDSPADQFGDSDEILRRLVAHVIGPIQLGAIEAMQWIGEPLSSTQLVEVLEGLEVDGKNLYPGRISYHMKALVKYGALEEVKKRRVRGAWEHFYFFTRH